jgi:hypothetical protein
LFGRRIQLQEYLRALVKIENVVETSFVLQQFLEINPSSPSLRTKSMSGSVSQSTDSRSPNLLQLRGAVGERQSEEEESVEGGRVSFFGPTEYISIESALAGGVGAEG